MSHIDINHCGVARINPKVTEAVTEFQKNREVLGARVFDEYPLILSSYRVEASKLLKCEAEDVSYLSNTAQGLSLIANGYPFSPGDEIISYINEYPSNHYPWKLQEKRGVVLKLLSNSNPDGESPRKWTFENLEQLVTEKTKVIALSHVQFTSGFKANLERLAKFSKERNIDLIIDAAQSLGSMPIYPEDLGLAAVAASGWKWLMGPIGSGVLYTNKKFREKIAPVMAGADLMRQGDDYLNHTWQPHTDARFFEYSSSALGMTIGLTAALKSINEFGIENVSKKIFQLQDSLLSKLDQSKYSALRFEEVNRSGIQTILPGQDPVELSKKLIAVGLTMTSRGGYLRIAPHYYNTEAEVSRAAEILNELG